MKSLLTECANKLRNLVKPSNVVLVDRLTTSLVVKLDDTDRGVTKTVSVISER